MWKVCLDEGDHSAVLDADNVRRVVVADFIGPIAETHCGHSRLHFNVVLDGNGHAEKIGKVLICIPLLMKGDVALSRGRTLLIALLGFLEREFKVVFCDDA